MFDARLRFALAPTFDAAARLIDFPVVTPNRLTALNLAAGLASAALAASQHWLLALVMWLLCRLADGLDGSLARRRAVSHSAASGQGGFWDICADFIVYGATVIGVAIGASAGHEAPWLPFMLVLFGYYINGASLLAFSSIAERTGKQLNDGRSLSFLGGLAEGAETIVVHSLWLIFPAAAAHIAVVWAVLVCISAAHRITAGLHALR
jgi:phosphatidylserine synthase